MSVLEKIDEYVKAVETKLRDLESKKTGALKLVEEAEAEALTVIAKLAEVGIHPASEPPIPLDANGQPVELDANGQPIALEPHEVAAGA